MNRLSPDRVRLVEKIIQRCGLPKGKKTVGYFSIDQLRALSIFIDGLKEENVRKQSVESPESKSV